MSSKYDFGDSTDSGTSGGDGEDRGYAPSFKIAPFTKMGGMLSHIFVSGSDYGQSIAVSYENAHLVDGILTKRVDKEQYKLFSWDDAPVIEDETLCCDDLPPVLNKSYVGTSYKYEIIAARLEADEDVGYDDDSTADNPDPIPVATLLKDKNGDPEDRFVVWEGSTEDGPNSCAKTTMKILSAGGADNVLDEDSHFNWAEEQVELRPELVGMKVQYAKVSRQSNESDNNFNHPIFVDAESGNMILADNGDDGGNDDSTETTDTPDDTEEAGDDPVSEFYATCKELSIDTEPAVIGLLEDMVNDDDNDLTESMVDRDEIVDTLVA